MYARAECSNNDAHYDRSSGYAEFHRCTHSRYRDRYHSYGKTHEQSEEYGAEVRLVEHLHGIAEESLGVVYVDGCAHNGHAVAILQVQVVGGKQLYVASHHAAHVHAIGLAHVQRAECLAVELGACHHYDAALDG